MSQPPPSPPESDSVMRISIADTKAPHVDDLLRRQANLRGDTGISRDRGGKWYYRNWFVLMIAGFVAALIGWALIEPIFSDLPYIEGNIVKLQSVGTLGKGTITIGKEEYIVIDETKELSANGKQSKLVFSSLHEGERVGIYVHVPDTPEEVQALGANHLAIFVKRDVAPSSHGDDLQAVMRTRELGSILLFPVVAGLVGLGIGAADGLLCRMPRRILIAGFIGLITGLVGGFVSLILAGMLYGLVHHWAMNQTGGGAMGLSTLGFLGQIMARGLAWAVAGIAMGIGQGLALRSGKVLFYGFLGGLLGGLFGGILFDPIYLLVSGDGNPSAYMSRMISLSIIGLSVGLMIGIVELLARDAWLRMVAGPLAGKEFLIFKSTMNVGASPKSDIYLFNDAGVAATHAVIRANGDTYEIESSSTVHPLTVNNRTVNRSRLKHGDQIGLGRTVFVFQRKRG